MPSTTDLIFTRRRPSPSFLQQISQSLTGGKKYNTLQARRTLCAPSTEEAKRNPPSNFHHSATMRIAYYMPFKPLGHIIPSGDLIIGTELYNHLAADGHQIELASRLRCRWIFLRPALLLQMLRERHRVRLELSQPSKRPDLWLSYHCYYKAPDMLGPWCARRLQIPYTIFQGIYSTKRKRDLRTAPGFHLNRQSLLAAAHVFSNKHRDHRNLQRLLPAERLSYIPPGLHPDEFTRDDGWRRKMRDQWQAGDDVVICCAAMMRPDVKSEGIQLVITSCAGLAARGLRFRLIVIGDGSERTRLERMATEMLGNRAVFAGKVPRHEMYRYFSGGDLFAFPGINESLGMVYLEAQSCGLPVVAYGDWGGGEAVLHEQTGLLASAAAPAPPNDFEAKLEALLSNSELRNQLGLQAAQHIRKNHDLTRNYQKVALKLKEIARSPKSFTTPR